MKVNVRQKGGFLGVDQELEIEDGKASVMEDGKVKRVSQLDDIVRQRIEGLAERVSGESVVHRKSEYPPSDAMETDVSIVNGPTQTKFRLISGDDASEDVYEFLAITGRLLSEE